VRERKLPREHADLAALLDVQPEEQRASADAIRTH
jgi:hypothetical protein